MSNRSTDGCVAGRIATVENQHARLHGIADELTVLHQLFDLDLLPMAC